jgi:hypothetical protein
MEDPYFYKLFQIMYEKKEPQMKILFDILSNNVCLPEIEYHNFCLHHLYRISHELQNQSFSNDDLDKYYEISMGKFTVDLINSNIQKIKPSNLEEVYIFKTLSDYFNKGDLYTLSVLHWIRKIHLKIDYISCPNLIVEAESVNLPNKFISDLISNFIRSKKIKYIRYVSVMLSIFSNNEIILLSDFVKSPIMEVLSLYINPNKFDKKTEEFEEIEISLY